METTATAPTPKEAPKPKRKRTSSKAATTANISVTSATTAANEGVTPSLSQQPQEGGGSGRGSKSKRGGTGGRGRGGRGRGGRGSKTAATTSAPSDAAAAMLATTAAGDVTPSTASTTTTSGGTGGGGRRRSRASAKGASTTTSTTATTGEETPGAEAEGERRKKKKRKVTPSQPSAAGGGPGTAVQEAVPSASPSSAPNASDRLQEEAAPQPQPLAMLGEVIVVHPGSHTLKVGRAQDSLPQLIPNAVARRLTLKEEGEKGQQNTCPEEEAGVWRRRAVQGVASELLHQKRPLVDDVERFGPSNSTEKVTWDDDDGFVWTDVSSGPRFVVGYEALRVPFEKEPYVLQCPFRGGRLNISEDYPMQAVLNDIHAIWEHAFQRILHLPLSPEKDYSIYSVALVIPDLFDRRDLQLLTDLLLLQMKFKSILFLQESVAAAFGSGLTSVCVVDIGHNKTTVACIDEGTCVAPTRITLDYGGWHLSELLGWFLRHSERHYFPYPSCSLTNPLDELLLHEIKRECCHLDIDNQATQIFSFYERHPDRPTLLHHFNLSDAAILVPMSLFYPELLHNAETPKNEGESMELQENEQQQQQQQEGSAVPTAATTTTAARGTNTAASSAAPTLYLPLDKAVLASMTQIPQRSKEGKKKVVGNVVLAGGSSLFPGLRETLEERVNRAISPSTSAASAPTSTSSSSSSSSTSSSTSSASSSSSSSTGAGGSGGPEAEGAGEGGEWEGGKVEVLGSKRKEAELDPRFLTWKGAAIVSSLDAAYDSFIPAKRWATTPDKALCEQALFSLH